VRIGLAAHEAAVQFRRIVAVAFGQDLLAKLVADFRAGDAVLAEPR
jgi:hypothetical protein